MAIHVQMVARLTLALLLLWSRIQSCSQSGDPCPRNTPVAVDSEYAQQHPAHFLLWMRHSRYRLARSRLLSYERGSHRLILLLLSGIEPNPGPRTPRFPCGICSKACKNNQSALGCDECDQWVHRTCLDMSPPTFQQLAASIDPWFCPRCNSQNNSHISYTVPLDAPSNSTRLHITPDKSSSHRSMFSSSEESSLQSTSDESLPSSVDSSLPSPGNASSFHSPRAASSPQHKVNKLNPEPKSQLRILNINFQSLRKKGKQLEAVIDSTNPDIIIGTETWLDANISSSEIIPNYMGFEVHRRDRRNDPHGGGGTHSNKKRTPIRRSMSVKEHRTDQWFNQTF